MRDPRSDFSASGLAPELFVRDLAASLRFYQETLGFGVVRQDAAFAVLSLGDARIQLVVPDESTRAWLAAGPRGVGVNLRVIVDDVDTLYARARSRGGFA
jgi:catechol 2,3-dioxygenase-like lactoylglutathione lyase family enzyme